MVFAWATLGFVVSAGFFGAAHFRRLAYGCLGCAILTSIAFIFTQGLG